MDLSVIIPVFNAERTLETSFLSVYENLKDTELKFEIILVNDGSSDGSFQVINELLRKFSQDIVVIDQENHGASVARNAGIHIAKGQFIAFNDSDDIWEPNSFVKRLAILKKYQNVDCVAANHDIDEQRLWFLKKISDGLFEISLNSQMFKCYFSPPTILMRRTVVDTGLKFNPKLTHAEEGYFFNHVVARHKCFFLNVRTSRSITNKKRFGESGLSGDLSKMQYGEIYNLEDAYHNLHNSNFLYLLSFCFSYLKYFRRRIIVFARRYK